MDTTSGICWLCEIDENSDNSVHSDTVWFQNVEYGKPVFLKTENST